MDPGSVMEGGWLAERLFWVFVIFGSNLFTGIIAIRSSEKAMAKVIGDRDVEMMAGPLDKVIDHDASVIRELQEVIDVQGKMISDAADQNNKTLDRAAWMAKEIICASRGIDASNNGDAPKILDPPKSAPVPSRTPELESSDRAS